jgi:hypothetical protein
MFIKNNLNIMKPWLILVSFSVLLTHKVFSQTAITISQVRDNIGDSVFLYAHVIHDHYDVPSKTCFLSLGDFNGITAITVIVNNVHDSGRVKWLLNLRGRNVTVIGTVSGYKAKPLMRIQDDDKHIFIGGLLIDPAPAAPPPLGKNIAIPDAAAHTGELINLCDTVHAYPVAADSLTLFCMGGRYPNQLLTVAVKNSSAKFKVDHYIGDPMCVTGTIVLKNNKPVLLISGEAAMLFFSYPKSQ